MADYVDSLEEIKEIRRADRDDDLTKMELNEYWKMTGKLSWLTNSTHPDLSYRALTMSKKNNSTLIFNLRDVFRILKKVRERSSKLKFKKIGSRDDLIIIGIGDASFKSDKKAVGGVILLLVNKDFIRASLIH